MVIIILLYSIGLGWLWIDLIFVVNHMFFFICEISNRIERQEEEQGRTTSTHDYR